MRAGFGCVVTIILVVVAAVVGAYSTTFNDSVLTCEVTGKDRAVVTGDSGTQSSMRIYTDQCDVLEVKDVALRLRFDSASLYNRVAAGRTYEFTTVGFRVPVVSMFPTVLDAKEVNR